MTPEQQDKLSQLTVALESNDTAGIATTVSNMRAADIAELMDVLDDEHRSQLIYTLHPRTTAEVVVLLDEALRGEVVDELDGQKLSAIVTEMPPDDAADIVGELTTAQVGAILEQVPSDHSRQIAELLGYDEASAGGIMNPQLLSLLATATVGEAAQQVREFAVDEDVHYVYVVDAGRRLVGIVPLRRLVTTRTDVRLESICDRDPISVNVIDDQEEVLHVIRKYDIAAVPVLDDDGRLLGRITYDDVMDVAAEEAAEDIYRMAGTDPAELETHSAVRAAGVRMTWLTPCMLGTSLIAAVLAAYGESRLSDTQLAALIMFVPMIAATGGNAGVQSAAIVLRGLATGELGFSRLRWVFLREAKIALHVGALCGISTGVLSAILLFIMKSVEFDKAMPVDVVPYEMGVGVGLGVLCAILMATSLGITLPFIFRRFGVDPAIASGPLITTVNDILSTTIYLAISLAILT